VAGVETGVAGAVVVLAAKTSSTFGIAHYPRRDNQLGI